MRKILKKFPFSPFTLLFAVLLFAVTPPLSGADIKKGEQLYKTYCKKCHSIGQGVITGPDLQGVYGRVPSEQWMFDWIKNNVKIKKSGGDAYAKKISEEFQNKDMDVMEGVISDDDIREIMAYIKNPPPPPVILTTPGGEPGGHAKEGNHLYYILLAVAIFLLFLINILRGVKRALQNTIHSKKGLPEIPALSMTEEILEWMRKNQKVVALAVIVIIFWAGKVTFDGLMGIGVYQGYKPEQPIKFSHKVHAGENKINCVYCHSGAERGKTAGIPSANICMNCHKAIKSGTLTKEAEIAKIYEAVGWNPEKQVYDKPEKPIRWVRVHALPDFAWFNHQQHVVVGKQDCKNCHGEVEKMEEAEQFSPLTMGWCLDCHRKTEVPGMKDNPYYEELHKTLAEKYKGQPITVEKMGGIECVKCHY